MQVLYQLPTDGEDSAFTSLIPNENTWKLLVLYQLADDVGLEICKLNLQQQQHLKLEGFASDVD